MMTYLSLQLVMLPPSGQKNKDRCIKVKVKDQNKDQLLHSHTDSGFIHTYIQSKSLWLYFYLLQNKLTVSVCTERLFVSRIKPQRDAETFIRLITFTEKTKPKHLSVNKDLQFHKWPLVAGSRSMLVPINQQKQTCLQFGTKPSYGLLGLFYLFILCTYLI